MASNRTTELMALSIEDLKGEIDAARQTLGTLKLDHAIKGLDNPNKIRVARREVARLLTEINRRATAQA